MFLLHFHVLCDLLLNRGMASQNLFVSYNKQILSETRKIANLPRGTQPLKDLSLLGIVKTPGIHFVSSSYFS